MDDNRGLWALAAGFFLFAGLVAMCAQAALALLGMTTAGMTFVVITDPLGTAFIVIYIAVSTGFWYSVWRAVGIYDRLEFDYF